MSPNQQYQTGDPFIDFFLNEQSGRYAAQLSEQALKAFGAYATSPFANPVVKSVAGQGYPGFTANFAGLPNSAVFEYLNDAAQYLMKRPGSMPTDTKGAYDAFDQAVWVDKNATFNRGTPQSGHTMSTALYDRFLFPAVIQQMQNDPNFAPFINELMGGGQGGNWE